MKGELDVRGEMWNFPNCICINQKQMCRWPCWSSSSSRVAWLLAAFLEAQISSERCKSIKKEKCGQSRIGNHPFQRESSLPLASFLDRSVFPELGARSTLEFFVQSFCHKLGQEYITSIPRSAFAGSNGHTVASIAPG